MSVAAIELAEIVVGERLRDVNQKTVNELAQSMNDIGVQQPISVSPRPDGRFQLVAGLHRLKAAEQLGWEKINATIVELDDIGGKMWESSENLHRAPLTELERAEHLAQYVESNAQHRARKVTRSGEKPVHDGQVSTGGRGNKGGNAQAAREAGRSRQGIARAKVIAGLSPEVKKALKEAKFANSQKLMLEVANTSPHAQLDKIGEIVRRRSDKKAANTEAPRQPSNPRHSQDERNVGNLDEMNRLLDALCNLYEQSDPIVQQRFMKDNRQRKLPLRTIMGAAA